MIVDAGLNETRIDLDGTPQMRWHAILVEAEKQEATLRLFDLAWKEYPNNTDLRRLARTLIPYRNPGPAPLLIVHSDTPEDLLWLAQFEKQLKSLHIPFFNDVAWKPDGTRTLRQVMQGVRLVVVLVTPDLLGDSIDRCELIRQELDATRTEVAVRTILVRSVSFGQCRLLQKNPPVNDRALDSLGRNDQGRYLTEISRRFHDLLKWTFRLQVADLLHRQPWDVSEHLDQMDELLGQAGCYLEGSLAVVPDLAAYLFQELLGSGTSAPTTVQNGPLVGEVAERLRSVCINASPQLAPEVYDRLCCLLRCLRALQVTPPKAADPPMRPDTSVVLRLLPAWVRIASGPRDEQEWSEARQECLDGLTVYLSEQYRRSNTQRPFPLVRVFHCLWLCVSLLRDHPPASAPSRSNFAYVLREGLRFLAFGYEDNDERRRPYYYFDAARYTAALCGVVASHAGHVLGAGFEEIFRRFLEVLRGTPGVNRYVPSEHVQHVLELYMAGQFVLGIKVSRDGADLALAEVLRGERGEAARRECAQAFCLAALVHDVGNFFLPRVKDSHSPLDLDHDALREGLDALSVGLRASVHAFADRCVARLDSCFSPAELDGWPEMREWLQRQRKSPGHGLFGAWYLLALCEGRGLRKWVVDAAARAVLLHNAVGVRLFAERDPVAALLVLGDEIYEWDPEHPGVQRATGKWLQVMALASPPYEPRDQWIWMANVRVDPSGNVSLPVDGSAWPTIHIRLQGPQHLATPVYQLWFRKSLNLGRIVPARSGFGPVVELTAYGDAGSKFFEGFATDPSRDPGSRELVQRWRDYVHIEPQTAPHPCEKITLRSFGGDLELTRDLRSLGSELGLSIRDD